MAMNGWEIYELKVGDVIIYGASKSERIVRRVLRKTTEWEHEHNVNGQVVGVVVCILRCSWTTRAHTTLTPWDLRTYCTLANYTWKGLPEGATGIESALHEDIDLMLPPGQHITCSTVRGLA